MHAVSVGSSSRRWYAVWFIAVLLLAIGGVAYFALVALAPIAVDQRGGVLEIRNFGPRVRSAVCVVHVGHAAYTLPMTAVDRGLTRVPLGTVAPELASAAVTGTTIRGRRLGIPYEWVSHLRPQEVRASAGGAQVGEP